MSSPNINDPLIMRGGLLVSSFRNFSSDSSKLESVMFPLYPSCKSVTNLFVFSSGDIMELIFLD